MLKEILGKRTASFPRLFSAERMKSLEQKLAAAEKPRPFYESVTSSGDWSLIAEIKFRSPSRGRLMADADPVPWAKQYQRCGAAAISVVTEENFFEGRPEWIEAVKESVRLPVLRKDFLTTKEEILESRALGADAVLLIAALLSKEALRTLVEETFSYHMEPLVEIHNEEEARKALASKARLIGINNRDLRDFSVDLSVTKKLIPLLSGRTVASESGIFGSKEVKELHACGVKVFLVGEAILTAQNPAQKIAELLGRICLSKPPQPG